MPDRSGGYPFSVGARRIVDAAEDEARALGHEYMAAEHLLLAFAKGAPEVDIGCLVATRLGADLNQLKVTLLAQLPPRKSPGFMDRLFPTPPIPRELGLPFTKAGKQVIAQALREADLLNHLIVGDDHILLALLREPTGHAAGPLRDLGLTYEDTRALIVELRDTSEPWSSDSDWRAE
jgi:ATP-dependent Clp protease ATP-binding subunit ClpC